MKKEDYQGFTKEELIVFLISSREQREEYRHRWKQCEKLNLKYKERMKRINPLQKINFNLIKEFEELMKNEK